MRRTLALEVFPRSFTAIAYDKGISSKYPYPKFPALQRAPAESPFLIHWVSYLLSRVLRYLVVYSAFAQACNCPRPHYTSALVEREGRMTLLCGISLSTLH